MTTLATTRRSPRAQQILTATDMGVRAAPDAAPHVLQRNAAGLY